MGTEIVHENHNQHIIVISVFSAMHKIDMNGLSHFENDEVNSLIMETEVLSVKIKSWHRDSKALCHFVISG